MKDIARFIVYVGLFSIPFLVLSVQNEMFFPYITGKNFAFRMIVEAIFAAWIILACYDTSYRPKRSWILGSFMLLLVVMFFANLFGESPLISFWSNFERMEGYMALLHTWMYFIVAASVLTTDKLWNRFLGFNIFVACIVSFMAFGQVAGFVEHRYAGFRADATLGNATYMAIYMLFTTFTTLLLATRVQSRKWQYGLVALSLLFMFMVVQTATRGTTLALILALFVSALYIGYFGKQYRKAALSGFAVLLVLVGSFLFFRDSSFIQNNPTLQRVANITLSEGNVRFKIWNMAYEGFKERPILGWGQSNFSYVFNKNYDPSIYFAESWYDRVHNIVFDWLIAGGILGALAYFSILFSALYYLFLRPLLKQDERFTVEERGVLLGLLAGYLFHNLFVFDNIVSYIYYGTILAFIYSRVGTDWKNLLTWKPDTRVIEQVVTPIVGVALIATLYFVNIPGIRAAGGIIDAFRATTPEGMIETFEQTLAYNSFGNQEIREQMTRKVQEIVANKSVSQETKNTLIAKTEAELLKQIQEKPGDARAHVFIASFYRSLGTPEALDKAIPQLEMARSLSPKKQQIIFEQGLAHLQKGDNERALEFFKEAYELDTSYSDARVYYAMSGITTGRFALMDELIVENVHKNAFYTNDLVVQIAYNAKQFNLLRTIFAYRIEKNPADPQLRTNLAYILNESGDRAGAIEVLKKAGDDIPTFKAQADQFIGELQ